MEPRKPPARLLERLRQDLLTEADDIARDKSLSPRQKLDRYLKHVKEFDAAWLLRLVPPRKPGDRAPARDRIYAVINQILEAVTHTASLDKVSVPPGIVPLGLTAEGSIEPPEYPDRPAKLRRARHLAEFRPARWEDQRIEASRWGDRDPARWGDDPAPIDDPRPMAERLAEWESNVAVYARQYDRRGMAAEEIYRPHGLFEQALPPHVRLDRISFRSDPAYTKRTLRRDLIIRAEQLLLGDAPVVSKSQPQPMPAKAPRSSRPGEDARSTTRGRPLQRKRTAAEERRSREVHAECEPALAFLGWSAHDWADCTQGKVSHSAMDRVLSGQTARMRNPTRDHLFRAMEKELTNRKRTDLLMTAPRWTGNLDPDHPRSEKP